MARVTVEDCLEKVQNRFALTVLASRRARQLSESRGTPLVKCSNKPGVTALREISDGGVRFAEDVDSTMSDFIEEQRRDLQSLSYNEVDFGPGSFGGDPELDGADYDDDIEELVPDLTRVKPENRNDTDDDDSSTKNSMDAVERRAEAEDSETENEGTEEEESGSDDSDEEGVDGFDAAAAMDLGDLDDEDGDDSEDPAVDFAGEKPADPAATEAGNA